MIMPLLRALGSLWFAAVLMVSLMVGMGFATVFESTWGPERTLAEFYRAPWFEALLVLIAINLVCAVLIRYPFSRGHIGFLLTHAGLIAVLGGALVTEQWGVDGQLGLFEGETARDFRTRSEVLSLVRVEDGARESITLSSSAFRGFTPVDDPRHPRLRLDAESGAGIEVEVLRFVPDAAWRDEVRDGGADGTPAVEVSLAAAGTHRHPQWLFAGQTLEIGGSAVSFTTAADADELARLLTPSEAGTASSIGSVRLVAGEVRFTRPVEEVSDDFVAIEGTDLSLRVLRYLPHAQVGEGGALTNASDQPINPAVECEVRSASGVVRRIAFANFPEFETTHDPEGGADFRLVFTLGEQVAPAVRIVRAADGTLHLAPEPHGGAARVLTLGASVALSGLDGALVVHRAFAQATEESVAVPFTGTRPMRQPALRVRLSTGDDASEFWLEKYRPHEERRGPIAYQVAFDDEVLDLGFALTLDDFHLGTYPGSGRPRSYESRITIADPAVGGPAEHLVSMNRPVEHGGFTFFQSSYRQQGAQMVSFLQVSRDPGQPVAFAGYVITTVGMLWVLGDRIRRRQFRGPAATTGGAR